jgi:hypothetical protein
MRETESLLEVMLKELGSLEKPGDLERNKKPGQYRSLRDLMKGPITQCNRKASGGVPEGRRSQGATGKPLTCLKPKDGSQDQAGKGHSPLTCRLRDSGLTLRGDKERQREWTCLRCRSGYTRARVAR